LVSALPYLNRREFDYQVGYFLPWKNALVPELQAHGLPVTCFGTRWNYSLGTMRKVAKYLRENNVQILHAHLPWASIVGRVAAKMACVPVVMYTEHGCWDRLHPVTRRLNRATLGWNDLTIAVSDEVRGSMHGVNGHAIATIANGIDCAGLAQTPDDRHAVRAELGIPPDHFVIVKVANLTAVKNHALLVRAFAAFVKRHPHSSLVLVGQLRERTEAVQRLVGELGVKENVFITGPRTDVPRIVQAADAFALSSASEGLPVSLLEAMALGKPVVCTRVGGMPGVITDGVEGFLVSPDGPDEMAQRFGCLCEDGALRLRMGQAGRAKVAAEYDIAVMVRRVEAEYRRLFAKKSGSR
jgi:glycosyltransferase involved in cell wall biosynthesis